MPAPAYNTNAPCPPRCSPPPTAHPLPQELSRNEQLTGFVVKDLNVDPRLPFEDNTFDVITNAVSVDYLNKPLEVGGRSGCPGERGLVDSNIFAKGTVDGIQTHLR